MTMGREVVVSTVSSLLPRPARAERAESMAGVSVRTERARATFVERMLSLMICFVVSVVDCLDLVLILEEHKRNVLIVRAQEDNSEVRGESVERGRSVS